MNIKLIPLITILLLFNDCGSGGDLAGGSVTETGNALTQKRPALTGILRGGTVSTSDISIALYEIKTDSPFIGSLAASTKTDRDGAFKFLNVNEGLYGLYAQTADNKLILIKSNIQILQNETYHLGNFSF